MQERTLSRRRTDVERIDRLASVYAAMSASAPVGLTAVAGLAEELLDDARNARPLRFVQTAVDSVAAHVGAVGFPTPVRHLASHAVNVAQVLARIVPHNAEWSGRPLLAVVAALLIDCGMTAVPVATLARPGGLPLDERRLIDTHAQAGAELILRCFPEIAPLAAAVGSHHERTDGTGYPAGLRGAAIPTLSRLLAVADVYAALNENPAAPSRSRQPCRRSPRSCSWPSTVYSIAMPRRCWFGCPSTRWGRRGGADRWMCRRGRRQSSESHRPARPWPAGPGGTHQRRWDLAPAPGAHRSGVR